MAGSVRVVDRGATRVLREMGVTGARQASVEVGVLGGLGEARVPGGDVTVAQVAEWAELGIGQPMRSWLRAWVDLNEAEIQRRIGIEMRAVIAGQRTRATALARIGAWMVGSIQARIATGIAPPNAQSTIDKKGSSTPLIDTGQLRSSITSRVVE